MNLIIMQFSPWYVLFPFRSKYPPQHFFYQKPSVYVLSSKWETKFHSHEILLAKLHFCLLQ